MPEPTGTPATPEADFDYDKEFSEMAAKRGVGGDPAPEPEEPAQSGQEPTQSGQEPDAKADAAEPAPTEKPEESAASDAQEPAKGPAATAADDDLKDLPPAVKAKIAAKLEEAEAAKAAAKRLENDNRSMAGRMAAYQRRYEEAVGKRQPETPKPATPEQAEEWSQFVKDYPDIAKAIEARFERAKAASPEAAVTQDVVQFVQEQKRLQFLEDSWAVIDTVHPAWRDDVKTKQFQEWKASSPAYEKLAASDDIADAVALFDLYSLVKAKTGTPAAPKPNAEAAKVAARREAQAEGARTPAAKDAAPNNTLDLNDEDQLFAFYAKQAEARMQRRAT